MIFDLGEGPGDVTQGPDGMFYTGFQGGRIVKFDMQGNYQKFVNAGGRPLGMQFDSVGNLIVADAFIGLISISPAAEISVLTDAVNGKKMLFVDDLDIAEDGTIWFSDASQRFDQHNFIYDFLEARPTGRLSSYSPETKPRLGCSRSLSSPTLNGPGPRPIIFRIWKNISELTARILILTRECTMAIQLPT